MAEGNGNGASNGNGDTIKIRYGLLYIIVPVSITMLTAIVGLYLALATATATATDAKTKLSDLDARVNRQEATISTIQLQVVENRLALKEVETQFCEVSNLANIYRATDLRMQAVLFKKEFKQDYPVENAFYPTVCVHPQD